MGINIIEAFSSLFAIVKFVTMCIFSLHVVYGPNKMNSIELQQRLNLKRWGELKYHVGSPLYVNHRISIILWFFKDHLEMQINNL